MQSSPPPLPARPGGLSTTIKIVLVVVGVIGALLFAAVKVQMKVREKQTQAMEELNQKRRDIGAEMKRDLDQDGAISVDTATKAMNEVRSQLDKMATRGGREDKTMRAAAEVMAEFQERATPYLALIRQIETNNPMDMTTVKDRADLADRRKFGQEMRRMNQDLVTNLNSVESRLREKLQKAGVSGESSEKFMAGFMTGFRKSSTIQLRVRKTDETIANVLIAMTDLMEAEWGKWKSQDNTVVFDDDATATRYNKLVDESVKAAAEQTVAQRELIELQQRAISR